jgi:hypothetical protein
VKKFAFGVFVLLGTMLFAQGDPWWRPLSPHGQSAGVTYGTTAPSSPGQGEVWVDTDGAASGGPELNVWDHIAGSWTAATGAAALTFPIEGTAGNVISYTFSNDLDTGIGWGGSADTLGVWAGGAQSWSFTTTGFLTVRPFSGPWGAQDDPTYTFSGDNDTGAFRAAADTFGITTGDVLRFSVSTAAATSTLVFLGPDGVAGDPTYSFASDTNSGMYLAAGSTLSFATNNSARMTLSTTKAIFALPVSPLSVAHAALGAATAGNVVYCSDCDTTKGGAACTTGGDSAGNLAVANGANWICM